MEDIYILLYKSILLWLIYIERDYRVYVYYLIIRNLQLMIYRRYEIIMLIDLTYRRFKFMWLVLCDNLART